MADFWVRLADRPRPADADAASIHGTLQQCLPGATVWWVADPARAWEIVFQAFAVSPQHTLLYAVSVPEWMEPAVVAAGAERRVVDVDPRRGHPRWPSPGDIPKRPVVVVDHPHSLPTAPPDVPAGAQPAAGLWLACCSKT